MEIGNINSYTPSLSFQPSDLKAAEKAADKPQAAQKPEKNEEAARLNAPVEAEADSAEKIFKLGAMQEQSKGMKIDMKA